MAEHSVNPKIDAYIDNAPKWQDEMRKLRAILLGFDLSEDLKWAKPCYAYNQSNIIVIIPFKETCALLFMKGALLKDPYNLLIKPGENTESGRQMRFTSVSEITEKETMIKAYIAAAIEAEKAGLKVPNKKPSELAIPAEFQAKLDELPDLRRAFEALTPGRQRAYLFYFSSAKQAETRSSRVAKYIPVILSGKGMDD